MAGSIREHRTIRSSIEPADTTDRRNDAGARHPRPAIAARDVEVRTEVPSRKPRVGYLMCTPEMARAMISRWISDVPSKMVKIFESRCHRSTGYSRT